MLDYIEYSIDGTGCGVLYLVYRDDDETGYYLQCPVIPKGQTIEFDVNSSRVLGVEDGYGEELDFIGDPHDLMTRILKKTGIVNHLSGIYYSELALINEK